MLTDWLTRFLQVHTGDLITGHLRPSATLYSYITRVLSKKQILTEWQTRFSWVYTGILFTGDLRSSATFYSDITRVLPKKKMLTEWQTRFSWVHTAIFLEHYFESLYSHKTFITHKFLIKAFLVRGGSLESL